MLFYKDYFVDREISQNSSFKEDIHLVSPVRSLTRSKTDHLKAN